MLCGCSVSPQQVGSDAGGVEQSGTVAPAQAAQVAPVPDEAGRIFQASLEAIAQKRWEQAEQQLVELTRQFPRFSGAWLNLGIVRHVNGHPDTAEQSLRRALAINPDNIDAYNYLAVMLRQQGRFADSEGLYLQALSRSPRHADTHLNLGILYEVYLGDLNKAKSHYQSYQSLRAEPDRLVQGWIMDIERRQASLASAD